MKFSSGMRLTTKRDLERQEIKLDTDKLVSHIKLKSKELQAIIKYRGVANVRFYASITTLDVETPIDAIENIFGEREIVECRIDESLYKIKDWYKITLVPVENSGKYGYEHYYITKLLTLINEGLIKLKDY